MTKKVKMLLLIAVLFIIIQVLFWYFRNNQIWDIIWYQQQYGEVYSITFSPNNQLCASGGLIWDRGQNKKVSAIYLWKVDGGILKSILKGEVDSYVNFISFSPDGKLLASSEALWRLFGICGSIVYLLKLWQIFENTAKKLLEIYGESNPNFSPDGKLLATCSGLNITLWQVKKNNLIKMDELTGHILPVTSVAFSPDGRLLASGDADGIIKLWRLKDKSLILTLKGHNDYISSITFSPNNTLVATGSKDGMIKLWCIDDNNLRLVQTLKKHKGKVYIAFSPDGRFLVSCGEDNVIIWRIKDIKLHATYICNLINNCSSLSMSPNGYYLAIGNKDGLIYLLRFNGIKR